MNPVKKFLARSGRLGKSIGFKRGLVFSFDLFAIGIAYWGAFLLRFDFNIPAEQLGNIALTLPVIFLIQAPLFILQGLYRGLWSFASTADLRLIIRGVIVAVAFSMAAIAIEQRYLVNWPRSVLLLDAGLLVLVLGGGRFTYRLLRELYWSTRNHRKKILIIGAGQSANLIAREFTTRPELAAQIVGFLDDNPNLRKVRIQGAPVLGSLDELPGWLQKFAPNEVIIAIPSLPGSRVKALLTATRDRGIPCRICPPIRDVLLGRVELSQLREVRVEDLLRRETVKTDEAGLQDLISGKRILVTGAGGSIGSELCRQVLKFNPKILVLMDRAEYNLYRFEQELQRQRGPTSSGLPELRFVIGDVLDTCRLQDVFEEYRPELVLHAAAYKHVPLMEDNTYEAVRNNVLGTYRVVKAAVTYGAKKLILISTDKAVRPTSVMGATKRMAETLTHALTSAHGLPTAAVRFGNVLDSEGSVLPLFRSQIAQGGPVTVTHPKITRYFMTIPEASILVLQSSILSRGSEVFLLDMGEPVLIRELAEELIKLSGLKPYEDIDIVFTGLRRGEKLYEELLVDSGNAQLTSHPKIMVSAKEHFGRLPENWESQLLEFAAGTAVPDPESILEWIREWVPDFASHHQEQNLAPEGGAELPFEPQYLH